MGVVPDRPETYHNPSRCVTRTWPPWSLTTAPACARPASPVTTLPAPSSPPLSAVPNQGEVDPGIWDQVGLELCQVNIQSSIKPQGGRYRGYDLANQPVEVGVSWPLHVEVPLADIVDGLIVHHERTVGVL